MGQIPLIGSEDMEPPTPEGVLTMYDDEAQTLTLLEGSDLLRTSDSSWLEEFLEGEPISCECPPSGWEPAISMISDGIFYLD